MSKKPKKNKVPTYNFTAQQIEATYMKGFNKGKEESLDFAIAYSMAVALMVLRDKFGFGAKRLEDFIDEVYEMYDSIENDYLDIDDIIQTIEEETGITIIQSKKNQRS